MAPNVKIADDSDKKYIDKVLAQYPHLNSIITNNSNFYRLTRDQYGNSTPLDQQELRLSGILRYIYCDQSFARMIVNLERWLSMYPDYCTKKFGRSLSNDFFSYYSEIEFYHRLRTAGFTPDQDPEIRVNGVTKKLDFLIQIEESSFFIEVITPRSSKEWDDAFETGFCGFGDPSKGLGPKNSGEHSRTLAMIVKEIEKHFRDLPEERIEHLVIIAMNVRWTSLEILIGEKLQGLELLPRFIEGILLYDGRRCGYYHTPYHSLSNEHGSIFAKLMNSFD